MAEKVYYVYVLSHPDGTVFYVGKGSGHRIFTHEEAARGRSKTSTSNVIRAIWASGQQVQKKIVFESYLESDTLAEELKQIALHDTGTLTNRRSCSRLVAGITHEPAKRYTEARVVDFPEGSDWKEIWKSIRLTAISRGVTTGTIVLEALRDYVEQYSQQQSAIELSQASK